MVTRLVHWGDQCPRSPRKQAVGSELPRAPLLGPRTPSASPPHPHNGSPWDPAPPAESEGQAAASQQFQVRIPDLDYGSSNRKDTQEDASGPQAAVTEALPLCSVGETGRREGAETANGAGPRGLPVKDSPFAPTAPQST